MLIWLLRDQGLLKVQKQDDPEAAQRTKGQGHTKLEFNKVIVNNLKAKFEKTPQIQSQESHRPVSFFQFYEIMNGGA